MKKIGSHFLDFFIAFCAVYGGIGIYKTGWLYHYRQPVPRSAGLLLASIGIGIVIYKGYRFILRTEQSSDLVVKQDYICPKCEEIVEYNETKDIKCPVCATKMEPLKGFYERHPAVTEGTAEGGRTKLTD